MPDTGENREIRGWLNAKEAEIAQETKKLRQRAAPKAKTPKHASSVCWRRRQNVRRRL
jgi:hypothetical protein